MLDDLAGGAGPLFAPRDAAAGRDQTLATSARRHDDRARRALSAAIDEVHQRLHVHPVFAAIADGSISCAQYVGLLRSLYRFHRANAAGLKRGHRLLGAVAFHDRAATLRDDLAVLGAEAPAGDEKGPALSDDGSLGLVYTAEGSVLGGKVINRQLDRLFGQQLPGRRFFALEPGPRDRWARVCHALEDHGAEPARLKGMCGGALASFTFMETCLGS